jgi:hypothetical protein
VIEAAAMTPLPAAKPTTHFRDMSYTQFARAVGVYGPACEDDYKRGKPATAGAPAELPVVDRGKPVMAAVSTSVSQPVEPVAQVAYSIDSTITLEGLRRY